jgi:3-dehydroquinate synthase
MAKIVDVNIHRSPFKYSVEIEEGSLSKVATLIKAKLFSKEEFPKILIITHLHLHTLYGHKVVKSLEEAGLKVFIEYVNSGESVKTWASAEKILSKMIDLKLSRNTIVLALGGGVIGDLAGFIAAVYQRGLRFVQIPTSLLAMVDSSVGGKVAVNLGVAGKNLVGAFHQPSLVIADTSTLKTLPEQEFKFGMSEVIKYAFLKEDNGLFYRWLLDNRAAIMTKSNPQVIESMINECVRTKAHFVGKDENEKTGQRMLLNLGHTFGHSIEAASRYRIPHGEAVAVGISLAARLALKLNKINPNLQEQIFSILKSFGLPFFIEKKYGFSPTELIRHFAYDKKTEGEIVRFIVPSGLLGHCEIVQGIPETTLIEIFSEAIV